MKFMLNEVRIAFAKVFEPTDFEGDGNFKFSTVALIEKNSQLEAQILKTIMDVIGSKWGVDKATAVWEQIRNNPNRAGFRDGDLTEYDGFAGHRYINASSKARPLIIDQQRRPLAVSDGRPYSGCYCNIEVDIYAYDNRGKGVGFGLSGIQFVRDGDAFEGGRPSSIDSFSIISEGAHADAVAAFMQ